MIVSKVLLVFLPDFLHGYVSAAWTAGEFLHLLIWDKIRHLSVMYDCISGFDIVR